MNKWNNWRNIFISVFNTCAYSNTCICCRTREYRIRSYAFSCVCNWSLYKTSEM